MTGPASYRQLRDGIAARAEADRLPWLAATLRDAAREPGALPGAWRFAQGLIRSHPDLLARACTLLEAEEMARAPAIAMLARLLNRREDFGALRARPAGTLAR